ncbi:MAG: hypothetical protein GX616_12990, partial [Planctomycetes bacterium]|nr:hypothetical protein [Planctomycetota bacterium]
MNTRIHYALEAPGFHPDASGTDPVFNAYLEFLGSDAGKAYSGDVSPAEDGSFEIKDVPPARYIMQVRVLDQSGQEGKEGKEVGLVHSGFDLTAGVGGEKEPALDVGTIEVQPGENSPKRDWGEAVEGLQCRLWAGRTHLRIGQSPEFAAAVRNQGNREWSVARSQELCELQVDGRWYGWAGPADVKSSHFPPGGEFGGISVSLSPQWQAKDAGGTKLDLRPGRHTIRVAFIAEPSGGNGGRPVRVVSNPVEIEIVGTASETSGTTRPAEGSRIVLEGRWARGQVVDGAGKKFGIEGPVYVFDPADPKLETSRPMSARSSMLDIREIEFMNRDNYPRVDVAFQFRDGEAAGGALFEMTLLDKNKEVLGTQRVLELRNREMPEEVFASAVLGGDDPPNRSGKAELYFRDVSLTDVDSYRLIVSEPDVVGLMRLLDEKDTYPRESAARALGQLGSAAKPAVPKLTQMLDDPEPYPRDAARQALQRIGERGTGAGVPATSPAARPRVVERPHRPVTMPAVTSRDTRPLFGASQPATQLAVRVIPLINVHAAEAGQTVRNVVGRQPDKPVNVNDDLRGNLLVIGAAEDELDRIAYLVAQLDKPPLANAKEPAESMQRVAKVVRPKHAKASDVADTIASLYPPSSSANLRDVVIATADEKKGMVMITCDPSMEEEIDALVAQVDTANPAGVRLMRVFRVNHVDPEELRDTLRVVTVPWGARCRFTTDSANSLLIVEAKNTEIREIGRLIEILDIAPTHSEQTPKPSSVSRPATNPAVSTAPDSRAGGDLDLEELEELLKRGPLSYEEARRMIRPDQAHELYPMLERLTFWEKGRNLSRVIGYVTKDEQAVRELLVYAKKTGGQYAFESIGLIGGSLADKILRIAFNGKATEEMSRGWSEAESELLSGWTIPDYLAKDVKSAAATGLVLTRKPENIALVKAAYEENRVYPKDWKERGFYPADFNLMTEAMAVNAVIEEKGMEDYLNSLGHDSQTLRMVYPYVAKYLSMPPEEQEASAPASDSRSATRPAPSDVADVPVLDLNAGGNEKMRYFLIGPRPDERVSAAGYKLVVVLPGGNGGVDFHPFVCRLFKFGIPAGYIVAQPVAFAWVPDQQIVWPTRMNKVPGQQFATEDFVEAVIKDVRSKHKLDDRHIYTLSWSSGGPAAYAVSLAENSPVTGSFVAMSVFKPDQLPTLDRARGRAYYLYHSPNDRVCPYRMAEEAESMLNEKAAAVTLKTYQGGHGWQGGAVYGAVRDGIKWIERQHGDQAPSAGGGRITLLSQPSP